MAEDPVERAARIRRSLADAVKEVKRRDTKQTAEEDRAEQKERGVAALLDRTRSVIEHTRRVIEQTQASLGRRGRTPGQEEPRDGGAE